MYSNKLIFENDTSRYYLNIPNDLDDPNIYYSMIKNLNFYGDTEYNKS